MAHLRPGVARKKLTEAARYFALGRRDTAEASSQELDRVAADMARMGFGEAAIAQMRAKAASAEPDTGLAIHPENGAAVRLLLALQTQWKVVVLSTMERSELRRTGLDYAAIEPTARMSGLEISDDVFLRLRVLESTALNAWAEEQKR